MPFERSVGAVVFRREKNKIYYLILKRKPVVKPEKGARNIPDYWDLVKGHPERGEKKIGAARREIKEETGISKVRNIPGFSIWTNFFYRAKGEEKKNRLKKKIGLNIFKIVDYHIFETKTKKIRLSREHIEYRWLLYEKAHELLTYKQAKKVLEKANKFLIPSRKR